jgi:hypothetical protein
VYHREEKENNWICAIKWELENLYKGYMWWRERENDRNSWQMVSQRCVDTETRHGHNHERKKWLTLFNRLKRDWKKEDYIRITIQEPRRNTVQRRTEIWRFKGTRKNV